MALFGEHRIRLDQMRDAVTRQDLMNDVVCSAASRAQWT